ncbi:MAG TPA: metal ABC transporter permease [Nitrospirae bacterium]|nr:metal ABC transporter permease [Nitrospirota bacterium]
MDDSLAQVVSDFFTFAFMQRALLAAVLTGTLCSVIGVFVVVRGFSFIGAGIAHASFAGVTLGFLLGIHPLFLAFLFSLLMVFLVGWATHRGELKLDISVGIFFAFTMALAILFIGLMKQYQAGVYGYLFGDILSVTSSDLWLITATAVLVLTAVGLLYKELQFVTFDQEMAAACGLPVTFLYYLLLVLIAMTVVVSLKSVGVILVFALIVTPAAAAYQLVHRLTPMVFVSAAIGTGGSVAGLILSYVWDVPSGATIVSLLTLIFFVSLWWSPKRRRCSCKE